MSPTELNEMISVRFIYPVFTLHIKKVNRGEHRFESADNAQHIHQYQCDSFYRRHEISQSLTNLLYNSRPLQK